MKEHDQPLNLSKSKSGKSDISLFLYLGQNKMVAWFKHIFPFIQILVEKGRRRKGKSLRRGKREMMMTERK